LFNGKAVKMLLSYKDKSAVSDEIDGMQQRDCKEFLESRIT